MLHVVYLVLDHTGHPVQAYTTQAAAEAYAKRHALPQVLKMWVHK